MYIDIVCSFHQYARRCRRQNSFPYCKLLDLNIQSQFFASTQTIDFWQVCLRKAIFLLKKKQRNKSTNNNTVNTNRDVYFHMLCELLTFTFPLLSNDRVYRFSLLPSVVRDEIAQSHQNHYECPFSLFFIRYILEMLIVPFFFKKSIDYMQTNILVLWKLFLSANKLRARKIQASIQSQIEYVSYTVHLFAAVEDKLEIYHRKKYVQTDTNSSCWLKVWNGWCEPCA